MSVDIDDLKAENESLKRANDSLRKTCKDQDETIIRQQQRVTSAEDALKWYANWDWTDKYVQVVSKRAQDYFKKFAAKGESK